MAAQRHLLPLSFQIRITGFFVSPITLTEAIIGKNRVSMDNLDAFDISKILIK